MTKTQQHSYIRHTMKYSALFVLVLLIQSCTLAPAYHRPNSPVGEHYPYTSNMQEAPLPPWKSFFTDPNLQALIQLALDNNRDLRIAVLNIEKTRNMYRIQRSSLLPTIAASAGENASRTPGEFSPTQTSTVNRQYSASLGFTSFELDLFGRIRSLSTEALENFYATEYDAKTAQISLVSEVAANFYQLVADKILLDVNTKIAKNRQENLELEQKRFDAGIASSLDLEQAKLGYQQAVSAQSASATQYKQSQNSLRFLLGSDIPDSINIPNSFEAMQQLVAIPAGLPSSLLERRPDILAAEHSLRAANANIGAARANFFPSITLTGAKGYLSSDYDNLFTSAAKTWSFLPQISLPIFDVGRNIATLRVSETDKEIAVAQYEKSIQTAFREVADSLAQYEEMDTLMQAEKAYFEAAQKSFQLIKERVNAGVNSQMDLLTADMNLATASQSLINTYLLRESNALNLYKALGGGWE